MKAPAFFSILLFAFLVGCSSTPTPPVDPSDLSNSIHPAATPFGNKVIHLNVPDRLTMLQMRQAILNAAFEDRWVVLANGMEGESGVVQVHKKTVFADTVFTFLFQPTTIDGYSDSYSLDAVGTPTKRYTPPSRIDSIRKQIKENLMGLMAGY
ncbi:MAG: hypothetical protein AAGJ81_05310 [Verrucomicrobiota bacterium]